MEFGELWALGWYRGLGPPLPCSRGLYKGLGFDADDEAPLDWIPVPEDDDEEPPGRLAEDDDEEPPGAFVTVC